MLGGVLVIPARCIMCSSGDVSLSDVTPRGQRSVSAPGPGSPGDMRVRW